MTAADIIRLLDLKPHPEGGHYRETFRDTRTIDATGRAASTAIYFLLQRGEISRWHTVDAVETWHYHAGAPLELTIKDGAKPRETIILGADLAAGQRPQGIVPYMAWQMARSLGECTLVNWTLVGRTVAPGFTFEGFTLADPGFEPPRSPSPLRGGVGVRVSERKSLSLAGIKTVFGSPQSPRPSPFPVRGRGIEC